MKFHRQVTCPFNRERFFRSRGRCGFTLLELLLALGLTVLVVALIGYLMQMYVVQTEGSRERIQQAQVARSILTMIADDVRGVVRYQMFDDSTLKQILSSGSSGGGGAGMGGGGGAPSGGSGGTPSGTGGASTGGPPSNASSGGASSGSSMMGSGMAGSSMSGGSLVGGGSAATEPTTKLPPPGILGTATSLQLDVSRIPRADQYFPQAPDLMSGKLNDIPSDTKTVSYFIQAPTDMGVRDPLTSTNATGVANGGLVRRQIDRSISLWAESQGQVDQLNRTGELIASEVLALDFMYFDGTEWLTTWDSAERGLPWVIEITIALQDPIVARTNPISAGIDLTTLDSGTISEYGIDTYTLTVAIPGAQLLTSPNTGTPSTDGSGGSDNGMSAMGLN